jgi:hypothetical protein
MGQVEFPTSLRGNIDEWALRIAGAAGRSDANVEDQLTAAIQLKTGLQILGDDRREECERAINEVLGGLASSILNAENSVRESILEENEAGRAASALLVSFLLSFSSRAPTRDRLQLFTTNYDRLIEYGCDLIGLRPMDRFVGGLSPVFRASRLDVDLHYNPPGIRGEPRHLEGVVKLTKLHGSLDWVFEGREIRRTCLQFGGTDGKMPVDPLSTLVIYPNPGKDFDAASYPYSELFRDFSAALCRPNSTLVTYGYGFGDNHINRVISDMLSISSTHLVVITYDAANGSPERFFDTLSHDSQISLLVGPHFGNLTTLNKYYLPKPAIDTLTLRKADLLRRRETSSTPSISEASK